MLRLLNLFAFFTACTSFGQTFQPLNQISIPLSEKAEVYAFSDDAGITLLFKEGTEAQLYLLDHNFQVKQNYPLYDLPAAGVLEKVGFTNLPDQLNIYYWSEDTDEYQVYSISKSAGLMETRRFDVGRLRKGLVYWGTFTFDGVLHILRMPRNTNTIRICRFEGEDNFDTQEFSLEKTDFLEKTNYELTRIENPEELQITDVYLPGKMYHYGENVYLTLDEPGFTYLISINLRTGQKTEQNITGPDFTSSYKSNSALLGKNLYQVAVSTDSLRFQITDIHSGSIVRKYAYGITDEISIQTGGMTIRDEAGNEKPVFLTSDFFQEIGRSDYMAILAQNSSEAPMTEVYIGGVKPSQVRGVSGLLLDESFRTVFFRSVLSHPAFLPVSAPLASSNRRPTFPRGEKYFVRGSSKGRPFRGYYNPRTKSFTIGL
ncbi:MAG: hypothetical protein SF052_19975 [Bacteroidia bacterium]|nr:hypothetical protein [Bacteroidia bacterium]